MSEDREEEEAPGQQERALEDPKMSVNLIRWGDDDSSSDDRSKTLEGTSTKDPEKEENELATSSRQQEQPFNRFSKWHGCRCHAEVPQGRSSGRSSGDHGRRSGGRQLCFNHGGRSSGRGSGRSSGRSSGDRGFGMSTNVRRNNPHANLICNYCKMRGHIKRNCTKWNSKIHLRKDIEMSVSYDGVFACIDSKLVTKDTELSPSEISVSTKPTEKQRQQEQMLQKAQEQRQQQERLQQQQKGRQQLEKLWVQQQERLLVQQKSKGRQQRYKLRK